MAFFRYDGHKLAYTIHGDGPHTTILMPGLLLSQKMQIPLATDLATHGNRVVTLDFLGHGASDRPEDMRRYSMPEFARQALGLLDHLELEQAIVGGTSLGANVTLELAALAPERLRGMVIEMPVLDNAIIGCAAAFTPLLLALTFGKPAMKVLAGGARQIPRGLLPFTAELVLDWIAQDPGPSGAVLQGILFGRTAPERSVRETFQAPTLVIGHPRDPVHPFSDAYQLAAELPNARLVDANSIIELPNARLVDANSIIELRVRPARLTAKIAEFVGECWEAPGGKGQGRRSRAAHAS